MTQAEQELAAIVAIRDNTGLKGHDWPNLPVASWVLEIAPNAAALARHAAVLVLAKALDVPVTPALDRPDNSPE